MEELLRNTLSPTQWAVLGAVPPAILALYFLKLRRSPVETPSTYLWRKTVEDLRVNSLWQRLRQSVLLFLQLLAVGLAAAALLRPGWQGTDLRGSRVVLLVDQSASMATLDGADGAKRSRLDVAKEKAAGVIDQLDRGMTAMIVAFAREATVVQEFTSNKRLLRERLDAIEPTAQRTDLAGALDLVAELTNPRRSADQGAADEESEASASGEGPTSKAVEGATLFVLSDGRFDEVEGFSLGGIEPVYVPIGSASTRNLAMTALEARQDESGAGVLSAYVQAANLGPEEVEAVVEVRRGNRLIDARRLKLPAGGAAGMTLPLGDPTEDDDDATLEARLGRDALDAAGDLLSLDDVGYAAINPLEARRVLLVTTGNVAIQQALATGRATALAELEVQRPTFLESPEYASRAAAGVYSLVVFDRCAPDVAPRSGAVYVGALPPGPAWRRASDGTPVPESVTVPQVIDWNRAHPLLASVELGNFDIVDSLVLSPPSGATTLIDAAEGPLLAIAPRDGYEDLVLGFPILVEVEGVLQRNTDWINRHSFPTFWLNALEYFVARQSLGDQSLRPGESVEFRPASAATDVVTVTTPSGLSETLRRRGDQPFVFRQTGEVGLYRIDEPGRTPRSFAVNLFDPRESDVRLRTADTPEGEKQAAAAAIKIGNVEVTATAGGTPSRTELWKALLVGVLAVLVLEWYVYHRRVAI